MKTKPTNTIKIRSIKLRGKKCPVTGIKLPGKGFDDDDDYMTLLNSKACLGEWDDTEIDCTSMKTKALERAWEVFMKFMKDTDLEYDDYPDMIGQFINRNSRLFKGKKLMLVRFSNMGGGCVSHEVNSYALLDENRKPVTKPTV